MTISTRYVSNLGYITKAGDVPSNTIYDDVLLGGMEMTTSIADGFAAGTLTLANVGDIDDWLMSNFAGHGVRVYVGDKSWSRNQFKLVLNGVIDSVSSPARNRVQFAIRDGKAQLRKPALKLRADGQFDPLLIGYVKNAKPIFVDPATLEYKINSGHGAPTLDENISPGVAAVYDRGVAVSRTPDNSSGTFTLAAPPAGVITTDAQNDRGAQKLQYARQMLRYLAARIDYAQADSVLAADPLDTPAVRHELGIYQTQQADISDLMDKVADTVGGKLIVDRLRNIKLVILQDPELLTPDIRLGPDDIVSNTLLMIAQEPPDNSKRIGARKNYTPMTASDLAGSVIGTDDQIRLGKDYMEFGEQFNNLTDCFPDAKDDDLADSLFYNGVDAQAETERRAQIRSKQRYIFRAMFTLSPLTVRVGHVINFTHPRFGFENGRNAMVVRVREQIIEHRVELDFWL